MPKADTGGILYLFPPQTNGAGRKRADGTRKSTIVRDRLEAIHPHDLTMSAREATEFHFSRIPFRQKRIRRGKNGEARQGKAPNGGSGSGRTVVQEAPREEQSAR